MDGDELDVALVENEWESMVLEQGRTSRMSTALLIEWIDQQLAEHIQQKAGAR